jgi:hypothetical protein
MLGRKTTKKEFQYQKEKGQMAQMASEGNEEDMGT